MICSLTQPGVTLENQPNIFQVGGSLAGGIKLCSNAAIGMGYNGDYYQKFLFPSILTLHAESSVLIAMRSHLLPSQTAKSAPFNPMDLSLPLGMPQHMSSGTTPSIDWIPWGEESIIELCEVQLNFDGMNMSTYTYVYSLPKLWKLISVFSFDV